MRMTYGGDGANLVVPFLWVGSRPPPGIFEEWHGLQAVVLCEPREQYWPVVPSHIVQHGAPFEDQEPTQAELERAYGAAEFVAGNVRAGRMTLVTCFGGRNRSGFVAALALIKLGRYSQEAIDLVRKARSGSASVALYGPALANEHFVRHLIGATP